MTPESAPLGPWARIWRSLRGGVSPDEPRSVGWRVAMPIAFVCAGLLATTSMVNARGTDLRGGRSGDIIDIVAAQRADAAQLQDRIDQIQGDIDSLSEQVGGSRLRQLERQIDELAVPSGLTGLEGPGLTVALDDAPEEQEPPDGVSPNRLIVHEEDLQAVVNTLWTGGAEGISLQGQRIITTTGIKCVGNTVLLQGVPYAPPYEIVAVGDPAAMYDSLMTSPEVLGYRADASTYNLGWLVEQHQSLSVPPFTGTPRLDFARAATGSGG